MRILVSDDERRLAPASASHRILIHCYNTECDQNKLIRNSKQQNVVTLSTVITRLNPGDRAGFRFRSSRSKSRRDTTRLTAMRTNKHKCNILSYIDQYVIKNQETHTVM